MKISFENYKSIKSIKSGTLIMFVSEEYIENLVKEKVHNAIDSKLGEKSIVKEIYVKNKIYNIVVK